MRDPAWETVTGGSVPTTTLSGKPAKFVWLEVRVGDTWIGQHMVIPDDLRLYPELEYRHLDMMTEALDHRIKEF